MGKDVRHSQFMNSPDEALFIGQESIQANKDLIDVGVRGLDTRE